MSEPIDMTTPITRPITRGELREELAAFPTRVELRQELAAFPTRVEMMAAFETWGGALHALVKDIRDDVKESILRELRAEVRAMRGDMAAVEARLTVELRRHTVASTEELTARIAIVDEKYRDLPARVSKLEDARASKPRGRRT
jgi:hypothetical protein